MPHRSADRLKAWAARCREMATRTADPVVRAALEEEAADSERRAAIMDEQDQPEPCASTR
ncbi:hypothetical protein [Sphingomonas sp. ID0503]|uniref:hypothetical protein n=1 Tax=Sphingomonas sp. ID0503 TaxID=3399691 RepID=UPI003AFA9444